MENDTKKINPEYVEALKSWNSFIYWLSAQIDQELVKECMEYEIALACRPQFIDRCRTKYNKIRAYNELKALEARIGKIINVNFV